MAVNGPPSGRQTRSRVTRTLLLDAAQEIIADRGYHGAAMDDIVEAADRSKGAAYFHFPSKSDIFEAVLVRLADRLESKVQSAISPKRTALERLDTALTTVLSTFARHRRMARIALVELPAADSPLQDTIFRDAPPVCAPDRNAARRRDSRRRYRAPELPACFEGVVWGNRRGRNRVASDR